MADVNGDGHQDILVTGKAGGGPSATLYLGDGFGGFSAAGASLTGVPQGATSIADVNDDGHPDLLITGTDAHHNATATLYLGRGDGSFSEAEADLDGVFRGSTSIADFDGDGHPDLLLTGLNEKGARSTSLYLGEGRGRFDKTEAYLPGVSKGCTSVADLNRDDTPDLLLTGQDEDGKQRATLYFGDGNGLFTKAETNLPGVFGGASAIADVDRDGTPDVLITGADSTGSPSAALYLGNGDATFTEANAGLAGVAAGSVSIADVDGDRDPDFLITGRSKETSRRALLYENLADRDVWAPQFLEAFPNPAREWVTVRFSLPHPQRVTLQLYDLLGRRVRSTVFEDTEGDHRRRVDVRGLPSGPYFLRLTGTGLTNTKKIMVVK